MLNFVNIENQIAFQDRKTLDSIDFAMQFALKSKPLDFQYPSTEVVSTFSAIKLDAFGMDLETISLSTSLISSDGYYHVCDGQTSYATDLECGRYYFFVNSKYKSEIFEVLPELIEGSLGNTPISVSGLAFYDNTKDIPWRDKNGKPDLSFGLQLSENSKLLPFRYLSSESISTFELIELNTIGQEVRTISLSTSLISSDGTFHISEGMDYSFNCGIYFFRVNSKYESEIFATVELESNALLLETGAFLLLETGGKLLLE